MSKPSRQEGFYWLRHRGIQTIMHFDGLEWWASGDSEPVPEHQLSEIDDKPIERQP